LVRLQRGERVLVLQLLDEEGQELLLVDLLLRRQRARRRLRGAVERGLGGIGRGRQGVRGHARTFSPPAVTAGSRRVEATLAGSGAGASPPGRRCPSARSPSCP